MKEKKKLLFLVTEDWYFCSHRINLARAALKDGFEVVVATRVRKYGDVITGKGLRLIPIGLKRRSKNPFIELISIVEIWKLYYKEKPDIVHHIALKPVIYGGVAAFFCRNIKVVNAIAGLGISFSSANLLAKLIKSLILSTFRLILTRAGSATIVQNPDDLKTLRDIVQIDDKKMHLIKGAGVNIETYRVYMEPNEKIQIAFVSRMLRDKGVEDFVSAVELLKTDKNMKFTALLVGEPDAENANSVSVKQLRTWDNNGDVIWKGYCADIPKLWSESAICVLPSFYGEGIPKSLIEAAACGRPIVTTDIPGCREIVIDRYNGILVQPRDIVQLANAIRELISNPELRKTLGNNGRKLVEKEFTEQIVIEKTLSLYTEMLTAT